MDTINQSNETKQNNSHPMISVVTCTYNSEAFLEKALQSVEDQSYQHIEHVINDSYSTDRTMEIIEKYIARNKDRYPIKLITTKPQGVANALNLATEEACGEIIHYLHSDDYYDSPDALEKAVSYFSAKPELVWLTGNFFVEIKGEKIIIPHTHLLKIRPAKAISVMNIIHHENTFMKREAVTAYGGFCEDKNMNVEYRMWLRLIQEHEPLVVNDQFTVFIIHQGSTSTGNIIQFSKSILRAFNTLQQEKVFPFIGYYEDTELYENYKIIVERVQKFMSAIRSLDIATLPKSSLNFFKDREDQPNCSTTSLFLNQILYLWRHYFNLTQKNENNWPISSGRLPK